MSVTTHRKCLGITCRSRVKRHQEVKLAEFQLMTYMLQAFKDSIDLRCVFGIVLADTKLAGYLADGSGVLGLQIFDIHKVGALIAVVKFIYNYSPS